MNDVMAQIEAMEETNGLSIIAHQNVDAAQIADFKFVSVNENGMSSELEDGWVIIRIQTEQFGDSYRTRAYLVKLLKAK